VGCHVANRWIVSGRGDNRKMTQQDLPLLVLVTGPPASGKTTLAEMIAHELHLPLIAKDDFKELLYDTLGTGDREWSKRLGRATFALMRHVLADQLRSGHPAVVEANFRPELSTSWFATLPPHRVFQLFCTAADEVLLERYATRPRHPGHIDDEVLDELRAGTLAGYAPLGVGGQVIELDTSVDVDLASVLGQVRARLASGSGSHST
jgi:predicted kinase